MQKKRFAKDPKVPDWYRKGLQSPFAAGVATEQPKPAEEPKPAEPPKPVAKITPEQMSQIEKFIEVLADPKALDGMLKFFKVGSVGEMNSDQAKEAIKILNKKVTDKMNATAKG